MMESDSGNVPVDGNSSSLDFSRMNFSQIQDIWEIKPVGEVAAKSTVLALLVFLSVMGNGTVIYIILKTKKLQTATNFFILNVAIADLLTSCYTSWTFLISDIYQNFVLGPVFCRIDASVQITCMLASSFSLTVISCDRLLGIVFPFFKRIQKRTAKCIIILVWLAAVGISLPPYFNRKYKERQWADYTEKYCTEDMEKLTGYWIVLITVMVWLPLTIMSIAYSIIIRKIDTYENTMAKLQDSHKHKIMHRKRVIKMLFIILSTFFFCWLPLQIIIIYRNIKYVKNDNNPLPDWYAIVYFAAHYLTLCSCVFNPVIYSLSNKRFRLAVKAHCSCWKKGKVHPSIKIIYTPPIK